MKVKYFILSVLTCFIIACAFVFVPTRAHATETVDGGKMTFTFEDSQSQYFNTYTQFDKYPWIMDGRFYCWSLAEQKVVLKEHVFTDCDVTVDVGTINQNGKYDAGLYVMVSDVSNTSIKAINVNVQASDKSSTYTLNIHNYCDGYEFIVQSEPIRFTQDFVRLRVVIKSGVIYVYSDSSTTPYLTYNAGVKAGKIGLRSYYSPNWFDNLHVIGEAFPIDSARQQELLTKARLVNQEELTQTSANVLNSAILQAENAKTQYEIDDSATALEKALEAIVYRRTKEDLVNVIQKAQAITNIDGKVYTKNSWNSLQFVLARCIEITGEDEDEISYWANRLQNRIDNLIAYKKGGAV